MQRWAGSPRSPPAVSPRARRSGVVLGADFPSVTGNLGRNLKEGRIGILSAIAELR